MLRNLEAILASVLVVSAASCKPDVVGPPGGGGDVTACAVQVCGTSCSTLSCGTTFHDCGGCGTEFCGGPACGKTTCSTVSCSTTDTSTTDTSTTATDSTTAT